MKGNEPLEEGKAPLAETAHHTPRGLMRRRMLNAGCRAQQRIPRRREEVVKRETPRRIVRVAAAHYAERTQQHPREKTDEERQKKGITRTPH